MKNTLGNNVRLTLWGESHGEAIGVVLDGICPGVQIDDEFIKSQLNKRRPQNKIETSRVEQDNYKIVSGVFNGYTTGEAICIIIENSNTKSKDYDQIKNVARPSHADYVAYEKYHGFNDYRGGGHFSGRLTAPIVIAGAIILKALEKKNILIATHIKQCQNVVDQNFSTSNVEQEIKILSTKTFPVLNDIENDIRSIIEQAREANDSVGGVLQTAISGLPLGLGEPWFSSVEGLLANAIFSIGAVKGIEFGEGFNFANLNGSVANDAMYYEEGRVKTKTNHNAGINGGITNGMPIIFNTAVKPTPSISISQETINFVKKENTNITVTGRHDPAIIRRMAVVIDSVVAIVIADLLAMRYGEDFLSFEE